MSARPFVDDDAPTVAALISAEEERLYGRPATALLLRTFAEFWRRGTTRVTLDVDSQNATGAVALYERVGMHVDTCGVAFEKPAP